MNRQRIQRPSATVANPVPTVLSRPAVASDTSGGSSTAPASRPRYDFAAIPLHAPKIGANAAAGDVIQLQRRRKLNPKQEAQRQRLLARRERRAQAGREREQFQGRVTAATAGFQAAVGSQTHHPPNAFPFDLFDRSKEAPVAEVLNRLPAEQRRSADFRRTLASGDAAHGAGEARTQVNALGLQETLAAHQFAAERSLNPASIAPHSESIDFKAQDSKDREVLFDPFGSPWSRPGEEPSEKDQRKWAASEGGKGGGAYYHHTHGKGGNINTIGVWDQTYTSPALERSLKEKLAESRADQGANVHELRVPLARQYAEEHVRAEDQIAADNRARADLHRHWNEIEYRHADSQVRKPPNQRVGLHDAIREAHPTKPGEFSTHANRWRRKLAQHPYWADELKNNGRWANPRRQESKKGKKNAQKRNKGKEKETRRASPPSEEPEDREKETEY